MMLRQVPECALAETLDDQGESSEKFPSLALGGALFYRWPVGIRFELGLETFRERAPKLYEVAFAPDDTCVVISQDWPVDLSPLARQRYFRVFSLPVHLI